MSEVSIACRDTVTRCDRFRRQVSPSPSKVCKVFEVDTLSLDLALTCLAWLWLGALSLGRAAVSSAGGVSIGVDEAGHEVFVGS